MRSPGPRESSSARGVYGVRVTDFEVAAILISLTAALAYLNARVFRLPSAIGLMATALLGSLLGLGLAYLGLWAVRQMPADYAELARLDSEMLLTTFALAIASSLLAGLLPAWRACQITPAIQLKSH